MASEPFASADATHEPSEEFDSISLWTFVHLNVPRFSTADAREVVRALKREGSGDLKKLARNLQEELAKRGIGLKHTNALQAAARLLGQGSWHTVQRAVSPAKLQLVSLDAKDDLQFPSWKDIEPALKSAIDLVVASCGARVFQLRFAANHISFQIPTVESTEANRTISAPVLMILRIGDDVQWVDVAGAAFENLRRHLEETGTAVLDGLAVFQLCDRDDRIWQASTPKPVTPSDACNSEIILLREDYDVSSGYELARGDEMTCWSQLELAIKDHEDAEIRVDEEDGAWHIGRGRYIWVLSTIHPEDYVPGLVHSHLSAAESKKLFRRYRRAKQILFVEIVHHEVTKRLQYLSGPSDRFRVDLHKLLLAMDRAGLTWERYCKEAGTQEAMVPNLPIGFVLSLLERLNLPDPNKIVARPTRSELQRVDDDALLRALTPRVDHVTYRLPFGLEDSVKQEVVEAIAEFSASLQMQKQTAA